MNYRTYTYKWCLRQARELRFDRRVSDCLWRKQLKVHFGNMNKAGAKTYSFFCLRPSGYLCAYCFCIGHWKEANTIPAQQNCLRVKCQDQLKPCLTKRVAVPERPMESRRRFLKVFKHSLSYNTILQTMGLVDWNLEEPDMAESEEPDWPHLVSIGPESVTQLKHLVHTAYVVSCRQLLQIHLQLHPTIPYHTRDGRRPPVAKSSTQQYQCGLA